MGAIAVSLTQAGILKIANFFAKEYMDQVKGSLNNDPKIFSVNDWPASAKYTIHNGSFQPASLSFQKDATGPMINPHSHQIHLLISLSGKASFDLHVSGSENDPIGTPRIDKHGKFTINFTKLDVYVTVTISTRSDSKYFQFSVVECKVRDDYQFKYHFDRDVIPEYTSQCADKSMRAHMHQAATPTLTGLQKKINQTIGSFLKEILHSGEITKDIVCTFDANDVKFTPEDVGFRVSGKITCKGQNAPGDIGSTTFPSVPDSPYHAQFNVNNYCFEGIFWAFFVDKQLHFTFNKKNTQGQKLDTTVFSDTPLKGIQKRYPKRSLIIDLEMKEPPTIILKEGKASVVYKADLRYFVSTETSVIEKDALLFVIETRISNTLTKFTTATNKGYTQLLQFNVTEVEEISTKVITTNIDGLDTKLIHAMWKTTLHPVYSAILNKAAQTGIALPSALRAVYVDPVIEIHSGYVSLCVKLTETKKYAKVLEKKLSISITELNEPLENFHVM